MSGVNSPQESFGWRGWVEARALGKVVRMSYEIDMDKEYDFLHVRVRGVRTRENVSAMARDILDACLEHRCTKVLIDVRALEGWLSTLEAYDVPSTDFSDLRGRGLQKAAIVDRERPGETHRFFETVARNRGFNVRIFENTDRAVEWLREKGR